MATKNRGISSIIIVVIILVIALAAGGYLYLSKSSSGLPASLPFVNSRPKVSEKDFNFISDPLVRKNFVAMANQDRFRIKSTSSGKGNGISTVMMEMQGNQYNTDIIQTDEAGKKMMHMIVIGDTTYAKDYKNNIWWKQVAKPVTITPTGTPAQEEAVPTPESFKDEYAKKQSFQYKRLGTESCDGGLTCYKYLETDPANNGATRTFWFDNQQYLLRKEVMAEGEFTTTNIYSYDNINISAPSPTKDVPEGKSVYEMIYAAPAANTNLDQQTQQYLQQLQQQAPPEFPTAQP